MVSWPASRASRARRAVASSDEGSSAFPRTRSFLDDEDESAPEDDDDDDEPVPWSALASSTLNLTMTAVGSVVLSLPRAFAECGWGGGTLALAAVALLVDASLVMLVGAARSARADSYEATGAALLGPRGGALVRVSLVVLLFGSLVSLQIIVADLLAPVAQAALYPSGDPPGPWASRERITAVSLAIIYPLTLADSVGALAAASAGAFVILLAVAALIFARFAQSGFLVAGDVVAFRPDPTSLSLALPVVALAYTCHFNAIEIDRELPRGRARRNVAGVVHAATLGVSFPFYAAFAGVGYATFGAGVSEDLLVEWTGDGAMAAAQAAVAVVNALKYPLVGFALRRMLSDALARGVRAANRRALRRRRERRRNARAARVARGRRRRGDAPLAFETSDGDLVASLVREERRERERERAREEGAANREDDREDDLEDDGSEDDETERDDDVDSDVDADAQFGFVATGTRRRRRAPPSPPPPPRWVLAAALFALHAFAAACAVRLRSLQLALDVVGATFGVLVAFVLPGVLFLAAFDPARGRDGADGLAWAAKTITSDDGRRVAVPRMRYRVLAWTLVAVGGVTSACGVVATAKEIAARR
jgi:amino acid permease